MFHGTSEDAAKAIANSDFRMPSHAGNFGKGLYFADEAKKSDGYAKANSDGSPSQCRVEKKTKADSFHYPKDLACQEFESRIEREGSFLRWQGASSRPCCRHKIMMLCRVTLGNLLKIDGRDTTGEKRVVPQMCENI